MTDFLAMAAQAAQREAMEKAENDWRNLIAQVNAIANYLDKFLAPEVLQIAQKVDRALALLNGEEPQDPSLPPVGARPLNSRQLEIMREHGLLPVEDEDDPLPDFGPYRFAPAFIGGDLPAFNAWQYSEGFQVVNPNGEFTEKQIQKLGELNSLLAEVGGIDA